MKKLISTVLALGMAASLAACGSSASTAASTAESTVESTAAAGNSDLDYIKGKGKMTIGYTVYEPVSYTHLDVYKRQVCGEGNVKGERGSPHKRAGRECPAPTRY